METFGHTAIVLVAFAFAILELPSHAFSEDAKQVERNSTSRKYDDFPQNIRGGRVVANWMSDGNSFWYSDGEPANTVIWKVDSANATKEHLFQVGPLRESLANMLGQSPPHDGLPFQKFEFTSGEKKARFRVAQREFEVSLQTSEVVEVHHSAKQEGLALPDGESSSPDGQWLINVRGHNLWVRSQKGGNATQLSKDGVEGHAWDLRRIHDRWWSADCSKLVAMKYDHREVSSGEIELARRWAGSWRSNEKTVTDLFIVDVTSKSRLPLQLERDPSWVYEIIGWQDSGLLFYRMTRDGESFDLMRANVTTGKVRELLSDSLSLWKGERLNRVDDDRFIWTSEKNGWNHLYLYDWNGNHIRQLTDGEFPVDRLITVDTERGLVYFTAHADRKKPYRTQLYRVAMDGSGMKRLVENTGQFFWNKWQQVQFSPSKDYFVYTRSSTDESAVSELRTADGKLVMQLSETDREVLKKIRWKPPEEFSVKAADGKTDLYGLLFKPDDFDPNRSYPVIDFIYGGDHISLMERYATFDPQWGSGSRTYGLAQRGFIVVVMDSRGTPGRSKTFHDIARNNSFRNYVIPDHVAAIRQLARERSYIDLDRVGVYGFSAGGHMAILAMFAAPDLFRVGVSLDFGDGQGGGQSLLSLAGNLKGKLLLVYGPHREDAEIMARALIDAKRFFDVLPIPGANHSFSKDDDYVMDAVRRYFEEHLE